MESFLVYLFNFYYAISELEQNKQNNTIIFFLLFIFLTKKWTSAVCGGVRAHPSHPPPYGPGGLKLSRKRDELLKRVSDCIKSGNHHTLDPSIDDGKWFSAKVLKENAKLQANCSLSSLPFVPSTGWRAFPTKPNNGIYNTQHSQQTCA